MKYIHLVVGDQCRAFAAITSCFKGLLCSCVVIDQASGHSFEPSDISRISYELASFARDACEKALLEFDNVVILLPNSPRPKRLIFSELIQFSFPVRRICWCFGCNPSLGSRSVSIDEGYHALFVNNKIPDRLESFISENLQKIPGKVANSFNRNSAKERHGYSSLIAFERLMFVIRAFLDDPGLSGLELLSADSLLSSIAGDENVVIEKLISLFASDEGYGELYCEKSFLLEDLCWLRSSGFFGEYSGFDSYPELLFSQPVSDHDIPLRHPFAGWEEFSRLMVLIRHLIFNPGDFIKGERLDQYLAERLSQYPGSLWTPSSAASVRHYLRVGVKPYIDDRPARQGHFLGSAVVSLGDLSELVSIASSSAPLLKSPQTQALLLSLEHRLVSLNVAPRNAEALSSLAERSIVNPDSAPPGSVRSRKPDFSELSSAISRKQEIRIQLFAPDAQTTTSSSVRQADSVLLLPLQFVFHRRAWYLAAEERQPGRSDGPIRFLRLDRFRLLRVEPSAQKEERFSLAFSRMCRLVDRTFGLPPNKLSYQDQSFVWTADDSWMSADVTLSVICRLDDRTWKFIREGPDRLPYPQLRMSGGLATHTSIWKPPESLPHMDEIYCLPVHVDSDHPFELQMVLPAWSVDDFDLQNWLLGFGSGLVLTGPDSFRQKLLKRLQSTLTAWQSPP